MKIDEQSDLISRQPEVRQHHSSMYRCNCSNGLDFHDDAAADSNLSPRTAVELCVLVDDRDWFLPVELKAAQLQLIAETLLMDGLQESGTQYFVNSDCSSDYFGRKLFVGHKESLTQRRKVHRENRGWT